MTQNRTAPDLSVPGVRLLCLIVFVLGALTLTSMGVNIGIQSLIARHLGTFGPASGEQVARLLSVQSWLQAALLGLLVGLLAWLVGLPLLRRADVLRNERDDAREAVERARLYDSLTGLPGRPFLEETLAHDIAAGRRYGQAVGLLRLDLDGFREANRKLGPRRCDAILAAVAERLRADLRASDYLARFGADEFCVVVPKVQTAEGLGELAARLLSAVAETVAPAAAEAPLTASIGVAVAWPSETLEADDLLRRADTALADAQREGGNGWFYHSSAVQGLRGSRLALAGVG